VLGDVLACVAGMCFASQVLLFRYAAKRMPAGTSMIPAQCMGSSLSVFVGLALAGGEVSVNAPESVRMI
jgi:hypothetical protein